MKTPAPKPMPKPTTKFEGLPLSIIILFPIDSSLEGGQRLKLGASACRQTGGWRSLGQNYGFVLSPRPNTFEAQLAFCQLVELSADLYIDCLIAAANPAPDSAGVDVGCANGIASVSFIIGSSYCDCAPFPPRVRR